MQIVIFNNTKTIKNYNQYLKKTQKKALTSLLRHSRTWLVKEFPSRPSDWNASGEGDRDAALDSAAMRFTTMS